MQGFDWTGFWLLFTMVACSVLAIACFIALIVSLTHV